MAQPPVNNPAQAKAQSAPTVDDPAAAKIASNLARLDGLAEALMERFTNAAKDAPESERPALREAFAGLESGLARLRAGLADGSLEPGDVQKGIANIFQGVQGVLKSARDSAAKDGGTDAVDSSKPTASAQYSAEADRTDKVADAAVQPAGAEETDLGETVRSRFGGFADSVLARLANAEMPDDERSAMVKGIAEAFASATARLDTALFDPQSGNPIDRGTYMELFSASLSALQDELSQLFSHSDPSAGNGVVYGADRTKEGLAPTGRSLDLAG